MSTRPMERDMVQHKSAMKCASLMRKVMNSWSPMNSDRKSCRSRK